MLGFWILLFLLIFLIIAMPWYPYSRDWGYWPGGVLVAILILWLILIWFGFIAFYWPWAAPPP